MQIEYEDMTADLRLCAGGKLYYRKWFMDERKGQVFDVTDRPLGFLMHNCELDSNLTLRDVFDFIEMHIESLEPILGNWVREFLEESKQPYEGKADRDIERLELYWFLESDQDLGTSGMAFPSFHGIGASGEKYGVDFSACNSMMNLPLSLKTDAEIFMRDSLPQGASHSTVVLPGVEYTLLGILYGIIWELAFYGPPAKRDKKQNRLLKEANKLLKSIEIK